MEPVERLIAIEEIRGLKAKYFRGIDQKDKDLLLGILSEDVTIDYRGATTDPATGVNAIPSATSGAHHGREACAEMMITSLVGAVTAHFSGIGEINIIDESRAEAIWPMFDVLRLPDESPVSDLVGYGHYYETYERVGSDWLLKTLRLTRIRVDATQR